MNTEKLQCQQWQAYGQRGWWQKLGVVRPMHKRRRGWHRWGQERGADELQVQDEKKADYISYHHILEFKPWILEELFLKKNNIRFIKPTRWWQRPNKHFQQCQKRVISVISHVFSCVPIIWFIWGGHVWATEGASGGLVLGWGCCLEWQQWPINTGTINHPLPHQWSPLVILFSWTNNGRSNNK